MLPIDPRLPTSHPPRSPGKRAVLRARAKAKMPLFVAGDAAMPADLAILPAIAADGSEDREGIGVLVHIDGAGGMEAIH